jgi:integrase
MRLTDRGIAALKPKADRYEIWEDGRTGLGIRVSPAGRKSWVYMYRFGGKPRRMTLGAYPVLGLAKVRVKHAQAKEQMEKGIDPGSVHVETRRAERQAETVKDLADEYLEKWAKPRKRSAAEDERILNHDVLPTWGRRKARDITRRDVILLLDRIVERGAPIQANRTLAVVRKMFNFAVGRDILDATPAAMVKAPAKENQRERTLSTDEIKTLWVGLDKAGVGLAICLALRLELATAQRKGEVAGARVAEFDLDENVWTIPAERSKNGKAHRVPLSSFAVEIIKQAIALADSQAQARAQRCGLTEPDKPEWLFPSPRVGRPITPESINHALRNAREVIGIEDVTPHDLRRSAASAMASLGINRLVISKVLNHVETGVTAVYDRHGYDQEKRHALDTWAGHLESIVSGKPKAGNVVSLAKASEAR